MAAVVVTGMALASVATVQDSAITTTQPQAGAALWVQYVTGGGKKLSIWTNKEQLQQEKLQPNLPKNQTHPWALETRWDFTDNVGNAPPYLRFVMIEMGGQPFAGTDDENTVLFGLSDAANGAARLTSYKSDKFSSILDALHMNGSTTELLVDFSELNPDNVSILYKYSAGNSSFFGVGGGNLTDGGYIEVQETVAENLVAPLEQFYDSTGKLYTDYITPLRYHYSDSF